MKLEISNNYDLAQTVLTMLHEGQLNGPLFISGPCCTGKTYQVTGFFKSRGIKYIHCTIPDRGSYVTNAKTKLKNAGYDPEVDFVILDSAGQLKREKRIHRGSISEHANHFTLGKFQIPYNKLIIIHRESMTEDLPYVDELVFPALDRKFLIRNYEGDADLESLALAALLSFPNYCQLKYTLSDTPDQQLRFCSLYGLEKNDHTALKGCRDHKVHNFYNTPGCHAISKSHLKWMKSNLIRHRLITPCVPHQITELGEYILELEELKGTNYKRYKSVIEEHSRELATEIRQELNATNNAN